MRSLGDTIGRLVARQTAALGVAAATSRADRLSDLHDFGSNEGALKARIFLPDGLADNAPLVVVLHGCTQSAADYDHGSGWSTLAERHGFALLFPEQTRTNNPNLCFNWFVAEDIRRGGGEMLSISQMIETMVQAHRLDRARVFVTGLSAGGAMAMALLATSPEVFAGGAIIAGVPFGAARTVPEAFDRMRGIGLPTPHRLETLIRKAAPPPARWPNLSVWQGSADATVDPANATAILAAWRAIQGLPATPTTTELINGHQRTAWRNAAGDEVLEAVSIAGMGHGTPLATSGPEACGGAGPYMLDVGVSSTRRIAAFWGIAPAVAADAKVKLAAVAASKPEAAAVGADAGIEAIIGNALRRAGLLR